MNQKKNKLVLVDADFLKFYATYPNKKYYSSTDFKLVDKTLNEVIDSVDKWLTEIFTETDATHYIGALTVGKCFRYSIFPGYKANRIGLSKPMFYKQVEDYLIEHYNFVFKLGYEADDIVNIMKHKLKDDYDCIIASNDQDILSLEGTHYNTTKKVWVSTDKEKSKIEFWKDMVTGQSGDGIKGIPGKGEKAADKIFMKEGKYCNLVFEEYINELGEDNGIEEFYKNWRCLKILEQSDELHFVPQKI